MAPKLVKLEPAEQIAFPPGTDLSQGATQMLRITNVTNGWVAYKVKTTVQKAYLVRPSNDGLKPNESKDVEIRLQPGQNVDLEKHRFLLQVVKSTEEQCQSVKSSWADLVAKNETQEYRLSVAPMDGGGSPANNASPYASGLPDDGRPQEEQYQELVAYYSKLREQKNQLEAQLATKTQQLASKKDKPNMLYLIVAMLVVVFAIKLSENVFAKMGPDAKNWR